MIYEKYKAARDIVWQLLIENKVCELPVKVSNICTACDVKIFYFKDMQKLLYSYGLADKAKCTNGFAVVTESGRPFILLNEKSTRQQNRFTVAHELGHIMLKHNLEIVNGIRISPYFKEPAEGGNYCEMQANVFASRLLAPACVMWGLGVSKAADIERLCDISPQAAEFRMKRLALLYNREIGFKVQNGKSCFLKADTEKQVFNQFLPYILKNKL